ncbi:hypothetical protein [Catenulispora subtropica]|uniref:hypothetical protein n=1 Tax=Catenulispora subtropica TaxID=450798 RepID=UPI0031D65160
MDVFADSHTQDPWFGTRHLRPVAPPEQIRQMLRHEIRDVGWPHQPILPAAPLALPRASYAELFRASLALLDLIRRAALESAPTTRGRLEAYRVPEFEHQLFVDDMFVEERYADCVARPDIVIGPHGPQFVEFNVNAALGGAVESFCRYEVWRRLYGEADGRLPYRHENPLAARAEMFHRLAAELGVAPRVANVGSMADAVGPRYFHLETDYLNSRGLTARFFEPDDLHEAWDAPPHLRYPLGLRNFTVTDFEELGIDLAPVQAALDHGCLLLGTQTGVFMTSKLTLGMLSEGRPWMSGAEKAFVDRYLPWTRVLSHRWTTRGERKVDLVRYAVDHRESLVLKEGGGMGGMQVVIGGQTGQAEWETAVGQASEEGTSIVQDFVTPRTCSLPVVADDVAEPYLTAIAPVFGPLLFGGRPAGVFVRFFGDGRTGLVSIVGSQCSDNAVVWI